jgi:hypothetical protein
MFITAPALPPASRQITLGRFSVEDIQLENKMRLMQLLGEALKHDVSAIANYVWEYVELMHNRIKHLLAYARSTDEDNGSLRTLSSLTEYLFEGFKSDDGYPPRSGFPCDPGHTLAKGFVLASSMVDEHSIIIARASWIEV